ncbi:MAG: saccharopine dehydrogenase NADP-binding domain-containing protein [Bacteroidales bacterium]|nr:saccharopine dehydrogenase NADP-binding domain-containing protein [Bacteroidales bacterium]
MKKKITVLGAGMVGKAIIHDLSGKYKVTAVDVDEKALQYCHEQYGIKTIHKYLNNSQNIKEVVANADYVVSAVPGFMGYNTLEAVIESGKDVVDISFMPEDFMQLNQKAKENGVTAIADCGVAPGMPNIILGHHNDEIKVERFEYLAGGLPKERKFPFEYKAPFSPIDVLEEYFRPARVKEYGKMVTKPAMSDAEMVYFRNIGHLEAFNTDGLRSMLQTMSHIPHMKEKTLRYPGHIRIIEALKQSGFFNRKEIHVGDQIVKPLEVTNQVLMKEWELQPGEEEFTLMRVIMEGQTDKEHSRFIYDMYDEYDKETDLTSMGRTTGFAATAVINLLDEKHYQYKGVFPPESVGKERKCFPFIMSYLRERGVYYYMSVERL